MASTAQIRVFSWGLLRVWGTCALLLLRFLPSAAAGESEDPLACGKKVELRLNPSRTSQGSLVLVEVRSASALAELKGKWLGQPLLFWRESNRENIHRALLGVDLKQRAGVFPLTLAARLESGARVSCGARISVRAGHFGVERLHVDRQFVELSLEDLARSQQEAEHLREIFAHVTPERLWEGSFHLPVDGVQAAGNFGRRRFLNGEPRLPHSGEDFPAPAGVPVHAPQRGRVVLAEPLFFSGNTVVIDHGLGLYTFYGHLESIAVKVGDTVEASMVLGRVGATGRVTAAHLHWAARVNEARVDPLQIVALSSK